MNDAQRLKDCIADYRKSHKAFDAKLREAEAAVREDRREVEERLNPRG